MIFRQLFDRESSTYTYILGDALSGEAIIIDPVLEHVARDLKVLEDLGLKLKFITETHIHADHITGAGLLRKQTGAKTCISARAEVSCVDLLLNDGDVLSIGSTHLKAIATPGHTDTCMSYVCTDSYGITRAFTGDCLLIRLTGRTDFQQGNPELMYQSITQKLFTLSDDTLVYPAHDYTGQTNTTIGEEKKFNSRIGGGQTIEGFVKTMRGLRLDPPKKIDVAVPANLRCGL